MMYKKIIFTTLCLGMGLTTLPAKAPATSPADAAKWSIEDPVNHREPPVALLPAAERPRPVSQNTVTSALRVPVQSPLYSTVFEMIAGRVAGVSVTGTMNDFRIRIRNAPTPPMLVLDNMRFLNLTDREMNDLLMTVHPSEIVRIEILRRVADTTIYGPFGANGVIVIETMATATE